MTMRLLWPPHKHIFAMPCRPARQEWELGDAGRRIISVNATDCCGEAYRACGNGRSQKSRASLASYNKYQQIKQHQLSFRTSYTYLMVQGRPPALPDAPQKKATWTGGIVSFATITYGYIVLAHCIPKTDVYAFQDLFNFCLYFFQSCIRRGKEQVYHACKVKCMWKTKGDWRLQLLTVHLCTRQIIRA